MISGAKASLPKMQNLDHSAPLHALDDYMHSVCSFLFKIFFLSLSLCLFFFVLFGFNDIQQGSNYTFKSNFHFFTRKWYNNYRKGVPFSLHRTRGFVQNLNSYTTLALYLVYGTFKPNFLPQKKKKNFHFHPSIYSY